MRLLFSVVLLCGKLCVVTGQARAETCAGTSENPAWGDIVASLSGGAEKSGDAYTAAEALIALADGCIAAGESGGAAYVLSHATRVIGIIDGDIARAALLYKLCLRYLKIHDKDTAFKTAHMIPCPGLKQQALEHIVLGEIPGGDYNRVLAISSGFTEPVTQAMILHRVFIWGIENTSYDAVAKIQSYLGDSALPVKALLWHVRRHYVAGHIFDAAKAGALSDFFMRAQKSHDVWRVSLKIMTARAYAACGKPEAAAQILGSLSLDIGKEYREPCTRWSLLAAVASCCAGIKRYDMARECMLDMPDAPRRWALNRMAHNYADDGDFAKAVKIAGAVDDDFLKEDFYKAAMEKFPGTSGIEYALARIETLSGDMPRRRIRRYAACAYADKGMFEDALRLSLSIDNITERIRALSYAAMRMDNEGRLDRDAVRAFCAAGANSRKENSHVCAGVNP